MSSSLSVSRLISVSVNLTPAGAQAQNLSSLLLLGVSSVIDSVERFRSYSSLEAVAADFLTTSAEYLSAALWFQQSPQPTSLKIGRWFQAAGSGVLRGAPLTTAQQALTNFTAVTTGAFTYTLNGGSASTISGIDLSTATNLNQVASLITDELTGAAMVWNATYGRFELTSAATGATSAVSFLTTPGSGTDLSGILGMRSTSSGAYTAAGVAAESALSAVQLFNDSFGQDWYAVVIPAADNADHLAVSEFLEGTDTKHLYGITTQEAGALVAVTDTDIASQMKALDRDKTVVQYSSSSPYAVVSLLARILTTNYSGNATTITLAYKTQPGITAETVSASQADSLRAKCCNAFLRFNNDTAIILNGVVSSGNFVDEVTGLDWLAVALQTTLYNLLYTTPTKVPQTDAGSNLLVATAEAVLDRAVQNGLLAPGVWSSAGFGNLKQNDYLPKGYYIWAQRMADQDPVDRAARKSPPLQIAAKLAGAIHEVSISVSVNK